MNDEIAWLKDVGDAEDPCYVPAAKGDRGAFPVYGEPGHDALVEALTACASIMPRYRMAGKTTGDDEELDAVLERVTEALEEAK
jgi:hypothetical protein